MERDQGVASIQPICLARYFWSSYSRSTFFFPCDLPAAVPRDEQQSLEGCNILDMPFASLVCQVEHIVKVSKGEVLKYSPPGEPSSETLLEDTNSGHRDVLPSSQIYA